MKDLVLLKLSMVGHLKDTENADAHILIGDDKVAVEGDVVE